MKMRIFKKAVLLIHGIAGGIFDLEELQLIKEIYENSKKENNQSKIRKK